jgi:hypothetical protein
VGTQTFFGIQNARNIRKQTSSDVINESPAGHLNLPMLDRAVQVLIYLCNQLLLSDLIRRVDLKREKRLSLIRFWKSVGEHS